MSLPKTFTFGSGKTCPSLGLGTFQLTGTDSIAEMVYNSIKDGTRLIDTSAMYDSEEGIGIAIKKAISEGIVKREDLFIISKLHAFRRTEPEKELRETLKRLQLDYIDLYLDHWPLFYKYENGKKVDQMPLHKLWPIFENLVEKGLTKNLGTSNYNFQSLVNLLSFAKIPPTFNEVEFHPYLYQKELLKFCKKEGIIILAYNPLCKGNYDFHDEKEKIKIDLLNDKVITELAAKYKKTVGQVVLNWIVRCGAIPIPATRQNHRMKENLGALDFKMDDKDYEKIDNLNKNYRMGTWPLLEDFYFWA